jgi:hypothetical protein
MARVAIDCDGVLADFVQGFIDIAKQVIPEVTITNEAWTDWFGGGQFSKTQEKAVWKAIRKCENFWLYLQGLPGMSDLAQWLNTTVGHDVWVVTSRATVGGRLTNTKQTALWLDSCGVHAQHNYLGVITVPDSDDKVDIASRLDIRWMIDDKVETIEAFDRFPYMRAALLDQPWNQHAQVKWRVKSVAEFLEAIK